jgi:hypothetical protein
MINRMTHDGVEMVTEIVEFMNEIKKKKPRLIFKPNERVRFGYMNSEEYKFAVGGFDIFSDDDPSVSIGQIYLESNDPYNYCVSSRLISNNKYSHWSTQDHRTKKSKHMATALKTAIKVLKPVELSEVFESQEDNFKQALHHSRDKLSHGIRNTLTGVSRGTIHQEMLNMISVGYTPVSKEFVDAMAYIKETHNEISRLQAYDPEYALVRVYTDRVEYLTKGKEGNGVADDMSKLPPDIAGKMFVLSIAEQDKFVEEIGVKREHNTYWVVL